MQQRALSLRSRVTRLGFVFIVVLVLQWIFADNIFAKIDIRFNQPQCATYADLNHPKLQKPQDIYCTRSDVANNFSLNNGIMGRIRQEIEFGSVQRLTVATMTLSHKEFVGYLCDLKEKRQFELVLLIDAGADQGQANVLSACGAQVVQVGEPRESGSGRGAGFRALHHNKFILVERADDQHSLVFSSANFSNPGLSINHELWGFYYPKHSSRVILDHQCLVNTLMAYPQETKTQSQSYRQCQASYSGMPQDNNVMFYALPFDASALRRQLMTMVKEADSLLLATNRFAYPQLVKALNERKQNAFLLLDDDLYWARYSNRPENKSNTLDVERISQLQSVVNVKYAPTSYEAAQKMHIKFAVADDLLLAGSGNFTASGLGNNYENFYLITDPQAVESAYTEFLRLWDGSYLESEF